MAFGDHRFCRSRAHLFDGFFEAVEEFRDGHRHVMGGEKQFQFGSELGQPGDGPGVGVEVGLRGEKVDWPGIEGVAGEEQSMLAIE